VTESVQATPIIVMLDLKLAKSMMTGQVKVMGEDHFYEEPEEVFEGEAVKSGCQYVHVSPHGELTPGCIVGGGLMAAGIPPRVFIDLSINKDESASVAIRNLVKSGHIGDATLEAVDYLSLVQQRQDEGVNWGTSVEEGNDVYFGRVPAAEGCVTVRDILIRNGM
jgi:hypothetical protein